MTRHGLRQGRIEWVCNALLHDVGVRMMTTGNRIDRTSVLAAFAGLVVTAGALWVLFRFDQQPWVCLPRPAAPTGAMAASGDGEAVLCVNSSRILEAAAARAYARRDSSAAWWNWIVQSFGPGRMVDCSERVDAPLDGARLLVVSRSACRDAPPTVVGFAGKVVEHGGAVILEMPGSAWSPLAGVTLADDLLVGGRLDRVRGLDMRRFASPLTRFDWPIHRLQVLQTTPDVEPLMWAGGRPVGFLRRRGPGIVVTLALDMAHFWQTLQQGRPDEDLVVRNRYPTRHAPVRETNDMVADPALLTAAVPVADALEDWLFQVVAREIGLPGWWAFPHAAPGALAMTHDEEGMGPKAVWMAEAESAWQCASTNFLVASPGVTADVLARYRKAGAVVGLHYVLPSPDGKDYPGSGVGTEGRYRMYGVWRVHPVRRLLDPGEQLAWLAGRGDNGMVAPLSRTHFLAWSRDYTGLFQALESAGIWMDSSYGPDVADRGYLFGTGRPFHPLDANGFPLSILELPFVSAEDLGGADPPFLRRLLEDSAHQTHQFVVVLFHPNSFQWHPSVSNYSTWKSLCNDARDLGLRPMTLLEIDGFFRARTGARLKSRIDGSAIVVSYEFPREGGTLVLPATLGSCALAGVSGPGVAGGPLRVTELFGAPVVLIRVEQGAGTVRIRYGAC